MDWINSIGLFLGTLIANTLASLSGGGAGLLQFPLLLFFGLPFSVALATHKVASVALGLGAAATHIKQKTFTFHEALYVMLVGCIGVVIGANLILHVPNDIAERLLGAMILGLGIYSYFKKQLGQHAQPIHRNWQGWLLGSVGLVVIGIINGSLTAGSGLLVTLFLVRWFGYSYKQAVALTMICVGLFWNGIGAIAIVEAGANIHWPWVPILLLGSFLGGAFGAYLSTRFTNQVIKQCFEILTLLVGLNLLI
ncbi:sulfite exporter TauE/SafE family protein [Vibrio taketomensis]|uniref:sulfite exporter TauE/SafE family protein n=1 Tax=Vibrio taketomensis TaxID=2572923 RepID=UPI00138A4FCD|nr:sulfite exporter TauE/SafE family protein [Vibrio taketomensis]